MQRLTGKSAIVTGASSGIGREAAKIFALEGASVVLSGRRSELLEELVGEIRDAGGSAVAAAGDICSEDYVHALVDVARSEFGGLDIAFNNAGTMGAGGDITTMTWEEWMEIINTNLSSAFFCAKHQIPEMLKRGSGSIIFTSTFVGCEFGLPGMAAYGASKSAILGLTKNLAAEYGPKNIRVNNVLAGGTNTPMGRAFIDSEETQQFVNSIHALKRMAEPTEIAQAALFLASDEASFVTGSTLYADGGASISKT